MRIKNHARWLFSAFVVLIASGSATRAEADLGCEKLVKVRVSGMSVMASELEYRVTRQQLIEDLLVQAATQVNGAEISARRTVQTDSVNNDSTVSHRQYDAFKARGIVSSYSFPVNGERLEASPLGKSLHLTVDVVVCDQTGIKQSVYIEITDIALANFEYSGEDPLPSVVASAIPKDSSLRYVSDPEMTPYRDFIISGQILSLSATAERNRLLEAIKRSVTANGRPLIDETRRVRLSAVIQLKAYNAVQDSYALISTTVTKRERWLKGEEYSSRVDEFIVYALQEAAAEIFEKIITGEGFIHAKTY